MTLGKQDVQQFDILLEAAKDGSSEAQEKVATMLLQGKGTHPDVHAAQGWYEKAAKQSEPGAYYGLATMSLEGNGVHKDKIEAYAYLLVMKSLDGPLKKRWGAALAERMLGAVSSLEAKLSEEEKKRGHQRFQEILSR